MKELKRFRQYLLKEQVTYDFIELSGDQYVSVSPGDGRSRGFLFSINGDQAFIKVDDFDINTKNLFSKLFPNANYNKDTAIISLDDIKKFTPEQDSTTPSSSKYFNNGILDLDAVEDYLSQSNDIGKVKAFIGDDEASDDLPSSDNFSSDNEVEAALQQAFDFYHNI